MWRELISQNIQTDLQRRANNPAVANFGTIIRAAMQMGVKQKEEERAEVSTGRLAAREATYKAYPILAAQEAGLTVTPEMEAARLGGEVPQPSWGQGQKVQALSTGLRMGKVVIGKEFGEPSVYEVKNMEDALKAIQESGLSPDLFPDELKLYDVIEERVDRKSKRVMQKLRDGRVIWRDDKTLIQ